MSSTTPNTTTKGRARRAARTKKNIEKEIKRCQESVGPMVPRTCMRRCIVDVVKSRGEGFRVSQEAQNMLQAEAERHLVTTFEKANRLANLSKRETVTANDITQIAYFTS